MTPQIIERLKKLKWSEAAYTMLASLFMLFVLVFAFLELVARPGAIFRKVTPAVSTSSDEKSSDDDGALEPSGSHTADPYASVLDRFKSDEKLRKDEEANRERAARALEKIVGERHAKAQEKFDQLSRENSAFEVHVQSVVGIPVGSEQLPDDFARLLAKQRTVAEAWASITNEHLTPSQLGAFQTSLNETGLRIQTRSILETDKTSMAHLVSNLDAKLAVQKDLEGSLDHIRAMLEGERFNIGR